MICLIGHVSKETGAVKDRLSNFWRCSRLWKEMSWESVKSHYVRRVENALKVIMHSVIKWIWMSSVRGTFEKVVFTKRSFSYCPINGGRAEKSEKWTFRHKASTEALRFCCGPRLRWPWVHNRQRQTCIATCEKTMKSNIAWAVQDEWIEREAFWLLSESFYSLVWWIKPFHGVKSRAVGR